MVKDAQSTEDLFATSDSDPELGRMLFGALLRQAREEGSGGEKTTLATVAKRAGMAASTLSRIETGKMVVQPILVAGLLDAYGITDPDVRSRARDLLLSASDPWWSDFRSVIPKGLELLLRMETDAIRVRTISTNVIEGLLQTEGYAQALTEAWLPWQSREVLDRRVELRLARQRLLDRDVPVEVLLDESVLHRVIGGPEVMRKQTEHLLALMTRSSLDVRILPFDAGVYPGMFGHTTILESPGQLVVYSETTVGNSFATKPNDVAGVVEQYNQAHRQALSARATREALEGFAQKYGA